MLLIANIINRNNKSFINIFDFFTIIGANNMLGVVFSGGQSSRMGTDKGELKFHACTRTKTAYGKISSLQLPVVVSVNRNQHNDYSSLFSSQQLITDNNTLELKSPLCGLLNVHIKFPEEDLLVLACDMPLMETELLQDILSPYSQHPWYEAFIYTNDGEPEPRYGIDKARGLGSIYHLYKLNKLAKYSNQIYAGAYHTTYYCFT